jgi:metal-responsive CopG/Arc/MetJ family transcriptional regulator
MFLGMKLKTSVTLSEELLARLDRRVPKGGSRSAVLERALDEYLTDRERYERETRDREILERDADELNAEAHDVLEYQGDV